MIYDGYLWLLGLFIIEYKKTEKLSGWKMKIMVSLEKVPIRYFRESY